MAAYDQSSLLLLLRERTERTHGCRVAVMDSAPDGQDSEIWRSMWTRSLQEMREGLNDQGEQDGSRDS